MFLLQPDSQTVGLASKVARKADITAVRLIGITATSSHDPESSTVPSSPVASFQIQDVDTSQSGRLRVTCWMAVRITWTTPADDRIEGTSEWELSYVADYRIPTDEIPEEIKTKAIPAFAAVNVPYNLWPYFRQTIQTSASEMGIVGLVLPPLRFQPEKPNPPSRD